MVVTGGLVPMGTVAPVGAGEVVAVVTVVVVLPAEGCVGAVEPPLVTSVVGAAVVSVPLTDSVPSGTVVLSAEVVAEAIPVVVRLVSASSSELPQAVKPTASNSAKSKAMYFFII